MHLHGSITALATPFTEAGGIDLASFERLVRWQLESGTAALVVAGSTGEASALSEAEYESLLQTACAEAGGRVPVLAGTGLSNTTKTIALTRRAAAIGADAAMVVTPPYVRPTQAGLRAHYRAIADDGALPLVLYNVPPRTGVDLLPDTVAELAAHERIIGFKEAVDDPDRIDRLVTVRTPGFSLLSGDDPSFLRSMRAGADGVVSVASNIAPACFARICACIEGGDIEAAVKLDEQLAGLYSFLSLEPNPTPVKALLQRIGIGTGLRLPLLELSDRHHARADDESARVRELEEQSRIRHRAAARA